MAYLDPKQIPVPSVDSIANAYIQDIIGQKGDTPAGNSLFAMLSSLLARGGDTTVYYVSTTGNDGNTGADWSNALLTIDAAVNKCSPNDTVFVAPGTYDEVANGAHGVECDVAGVEIVGVGGGITVTNTDTTNDGSVFLITAQSVTIRNITANKGETTSTGSAGIRFDTGAVTSELIDTAAMVGNAATHYGILFTGGAVQCGSRGTMPVYSGVVGLNDVGIGVGFENCTRCTVSQAVLAGLGTGANFGGSADLNGLHDTVTVFDCTTGVTISVGATDNMIGANITNVGTSIVDNSGNATNSTWSSFSFLREDVAHIKQYTGSIYVVDGTSGLDTNDGLSPLTAFKTIGAAETATANGDAIIIRAGTYTETGLDITNDAIKLWFEDGVTIDPASGTALTISGDDCVLRGLHTLTPAVSQIGLLITGDNCFVERGKTLGGGYGIKVTGSGAIIEHYASGLQTVIAYDIQGIQARMRECNTVGNGSTIGYKISNGVDTGVLKNCTSSGHATAGYYIDTGSENWTIVNCSSGGGDGDRVDLGINNMWANFMDQMSDEHHEHIYPYCAGEGVANAPVTVSNSTTDGGGGTREDQNYWGDVVTVIPPSTLTERWDAVGIYIHATTAADIQQWELFFPRTAYSSAQNGGNDWDENETQLTVVDGSIFQDGDFVWVTGDDRTDGEILKVSGAPAGNVVTVARETTADGEAGLRYDYDASPGNNMLYVASRPGIAFLHRIEGDHSAATTRAFTPYRWHEARELPANTGMLMRMLNATDSGASSFDVRAIYED